MNDATLRLAEAFLCYKQKCKVVSFNFAHPVQVDLHKKLAPGTSFLVQVLFSCARSLRRVEGTFTPPSLHIGLNLHKLEALFDTNGVNSLE